MEMETETEVTRRRLQTINGHLNCVNLDTKRGIDANCTAGEFVLDQGYSVVLPEKLHTGKWNVYRSVRSPLKLVQSFQDHPEIGTLHENFVHAVNSYQDFKYLGTRVHGDGTIGEYKWMTYGEAGTARTAIGSGLVYHGIPKGACIGLYLINRPEWMVIEHACSSYSYISVPLYDTLGSEAVKYIVNHADIQVVFCVPENMSNLLNFISDFSSLRLIVVIGGTEQLMASLPSKAGVEIITYVDLKHQGHCNFQPFRPPLPEDVATICYTSGTTGTPKGAVLSHKNLITSVAGSLRSIKISSMDVYISYLPLAHIYERANTLGMTYSGAAIGFYQGDNMKLMDDLAVLRPTIFASVPRLYNKIYSGILNSLKASGSIQQRLFNVAFNAKKQAIMKGKVPSRIWDKLVFNKIKAKLGGRVHMMVSGASPISPEVIEFLRVCFGGRVSEGYGMTESSCLICLSEEDDNLSGHVGPPNPACEVKLEDVPEMNYTSNDKPYPRGEVCVRGPIVFKGYFKDDEQTQEILDKDGWLHTGDIGLWLPGGRLKIIDRKKNIFKLAQGEYIAPEKIENVYAKCKFVAQCFIYGDSLNSSLVAVVAVEPDVLKAWAMSEGIKFDNLSQLCSDPRAKAAVLSDMDVIGREAQLKGFEFAKAITLVAEPFSLENGLLTPTFKIKRPQARDRFAKAISDMYSNLANEQSSLPRSSL
uniref:Long-chain-fatty-acid--CoA ligase n=1 Tax=Araucaria cunninghamii TaxID=56994 RepID=A0A0D6QY03_ARACU